MDKDALQKIKESSVSKEVLEILKSGEFVDNPRRMHVKEECSSELTREEKAVYSLYKGSLSNLVRGEWSGSVVVEFNRGALKEKIKASSKLFVGMVRIRLGVRENRLIDIRYGYKIVIVSEKSNPRFAPYIPAKPTSNKEKIFNA